MTTHLSVPGNVPKDEFKREYFYEGVIYTAGSAQEAICLAMEHCLSLGHSWRKIPVETIYVESTKEAVKVKTIYDKHNILTATLADGDSDD
jgi:hypothetical protein